MLFLWGAVQPAQAQLLRQPAADIYQVIALRVEFQPDTTRFTTGDGTFSGTLYPDGLQPKVDPLPHDAAYFQAHLDFLADYVATVSDGRTRLETQVLPEVVRVSQPMGAYSPTGLDADSPAERARLAALIEEAWTLAAGQMDLDLSGYDPEETAFVLFHAGVGRDIELIGTTLEKTPQDLPSLFFDQDTLSELGVEGLAFDGFPIRNTLLLPRTETRPGTDFIADETFLLELSINGLLAASFFNFLGVPDLFDTETGQPAIGPFGLMDPLGIFAYNGLFPPEPTAWTRYYLGWETPSVAGEEGVYTVTAASAQEGEHVVRIPISSAEYFLVENRNRDPEGDGLVLRVWKDGTITEQRVQNGQEDFSRFNIEGFTGGVVVGVDNYDWAVPGGLDEDDNELHGGILIWHVDERRLLDGTLNADPERRFLDLEEADSAQDLGFPSDSPFGGSADQGSPFDFWYEGNPITVITSTGQRVSLYENRFGPDTVPDSDTNEGGPSFVVLENFSAPGRVMEFSFRRSQESTIELAFSVLTSPTQDAMSFSEGGYLLGPPSETGLLAAYTGESEVGSELTFLDASTGAVLFRETAEGGIRAVALPGGRILTVSASTLSIFTNAGREATLDLSISGLLAWHSPLMALEQQDGFHYYALADLAGQPGALIHFREGGQAEVAGVERFFGLASDGSQPVVVGAREARTLDGAERWSYESLEATIGQPVFGTDTSGLVGIIPLSGVGRMLFLLADGAAQPIDLTTYDDFLEEGCYDVAVCGMAQSETPVLVDLDRDGRLDVLTTYGRHLVAFTQGGALVEGFPLRLKAPAEAQPLVAQLTDSGGWSVVVALTDGYVYAFDLGEGGRLVPGFPLAVGASIQATPLLQENILTAMAEDGALSSWRLNSAGGVHWGQHYGNAQHTSFIASQKEGPPQGSSDALIVTAETYNWPNPIRDGQTFLRCQTTEDARVEITIVDAAGALIEEVALTVREDTPAEHLWRTDASSGLYYARVTATSTSGRTDTRLIKMAVIR